MAELHVPVLRQECVELLQPALSQPGAILVDGTLGLGGHSEAILQQIEGVKVIGIDRDNQAIALATSRLAPYRDRFQAVHATYDQIAEVLTALGISEVQGLLLDLGISSLQIDAAERGFSYAKDAPLDMRMDQSNGPTAADILNTYSESELRRILYSYGEEKFAPRIAQAIVTARASNPWRTTRQLAEAIDNAIPAKAKKTGGHPAKRTFQAIRIEVNQELVSLAGVLPEAISCLSIGGRIVIESYQSLEDRLVKTEFAKGASSSAPAGLPQQLPEHLPYLRLLTRGAVKADEQEIAHNPRAASVRLRGAEKIRAIPKQFRTTERRESQ